MAVRRQDIRPARGQAPGPLGRCYTSQTFDRARRPANPDGWPHDMLGMPFNQMMTFPCQLTLGPRRTAWMFVEPIKEIELCTRTPGNRERLVTPTSRFHCHVQPPVHIQAGRGQPVERFGLKIADRRSSTSPGRRVDGMPLPADRNPRSACRFRRWPRSKSAAAAAGSKTDCSAAGARAIEVFAEEALVESVEMYELNRREAVVAVVPVHSGGSKNHRGSPAFRRGDRQRGLGRKRRTTVLLESVAGLSTGPPVFIIPIQNRAEKHSKRS